MDLKPISSEDLEYIKSSIPWMKFLGSGYAASAVLLLWKAFGLYKRLSDVEKELAELKDKKLISSTEHEAISESCQREIVAIVDKRVSDLHIKWLEDVQEVRGEISEIKSGQAKILGALEFLISDKKSPH